MSTTGFRGAPVSKAWMLATLTVPLLATLGGLRGHPVLSANAAFYPVCPPPEGALAQAAAPAGAPDSIAYIHSPSIWSSFAPLGLIGAALHALPAIVAAYVSVASSASHLLVLTAQYALARQTERRLGSSKFSAFLLRAFLVHAFSVALLIVGSAWLVRILDPPGSMLLEPPYRRGDGFGFDIWGIWPSESSHPAGGTAIRMLRRLSQIQIPGPIGLIIPLLALLLRLSPGSWSVQITLPLQPAKASSVLHAELKDLHIWTIVVFVLALSDFGSLISASIAVTTTTLVISTSLPSRSTPSTSTRSWLTLLSPSSWLSPKHEYQAINDDQETHRSSQSTSSALDQRTEARRRSIRQRTFAVGATLASRLPLRHHARSLVRCFWRALEHMFDSPPPPRSSRAERRHARIIPMTPQSQEDASQGANDPRGTPSRSRFTRSLANLLARRDRPSTASTEGTNVSGNTPTPPPLAGPALQPRSAGSPFAPRPPSGQGPSM